ALGLCLERIIGGALGHFMGIQEARQLLTGAEADYRDLVQEAQRIVPAQTIADVFRRLVDERVALKPIRLILGALVEAGPREQDPGLLTEHVRAALRRQISHSHAVAGRLLPVLVVEREAEDLIRASVRETPIGPYLSLPEDALAMLLDDIRRPLQDGAHPALLTSFDVRRLLRGLLVRHEIDLPVLSYQDLSSEISVQPMGSINCVARPPGAKPLHLVTGAADSSNAAE
ncbi:MAG TPA: FHIPEP family type III secretion protein, partial [Aliidongia sp.]|uniref:FHIPEP family type III secretion protein n=1 Tax=Aliidongia sp. TaxID=1914230 RepID=UPI002DDCD52C